MIRSLPPAPDRPADQCFYAQGKVMFTGEYLVLDGAEALAFPTRLGQQLCVWHTEDRDRLDWRSRDKQGEVWVAASFTREELELPPPASERSERARLLRLLHAVVEQAPEVWPEGGGLLLETRLDFDRRWGLGSSATLTYLLASFGGLDPYELNESEFGGSGYDVACAGAAAGALRYWRSTPATPRVQRHAWWAQALARAQLIHLGRKQNSRDGIRAYRQQAAREREQAVVAATQLTRELLQTDALSDVSEVLRRHEALVAYATRQPTIAQHRFPDYPGLVKSLGAWGGDLALVLPPSEGAEVPSDYFDAHGTPVVARAGDLLLHSSPSDLPSLLTPPWTPSVLQGRRSERDDGPLVAAFFYGVLADERADNAWLHDHLHVAADLPNFRARAAENGEVVVEPSHGSFLPGQLVYVHPDELRVLSAHPKGRNRRRTTLNVRLPGEGGGLRCRAQVWLPRS